MAEMDRSKRYANPPKRPKKGGGMQDKQEVKAEHEVKKGVGPADGAPSAAHPGPVGKVGSDPGPDKGHDAIWGVVAERHKAERTEMNTRHTSEMSDMHTRHAKEHGDMGKRHTKELQDHMETAAAHKIEATAGSPKELGTAKSEGKKGSEP